ncbi:arginyl-tRNA--protein transferase 1 isoform X2 [Procambarus clarkii]|uniref:arginyl-tRNA--protein transferase 1 isoform X2 n=1 Tax=Procambarus clarkii TaxID=6728 RepID=UPI001E677D96|nr:arginyl-tRNA--protein transferase 1-like isoform X3 [Procambarus clarkii]
MAEGDQDPSCSIVEYMRDHSGYKCGYCKSENTNFSHGMWAHRLAVNHYQDLIDRGWRRSGKYCYKPIMDKTCCPMYTIKCDILEFKLSKSQKKILKRIHRYLSHGDVKEERSLGNDNSGNIQGNPEYVKPRLESTQDLSSVSLSANATNTRKNSEPYTLETNDGSLNSKKACVNPKMEKNVSCHKTNLESSSQHSFQAKKVTSTGPDPNRPPCRKAKEVRRERKEAKLAKIAQEAVTRGESPMDTKKFKPSNTQKTLEDYINEPLPENPAHNLELKLVRVSPPGAAFRASYNVSHAVFRNYQIHVHHDSESECDKKSFQGFLVDGPFSGWHPHTGPQQGYGSFHHQYWLDGRLIAVGVLDILPHCVSSVYLYYDPEFSFLSLGTYASLREIALTRELQRRVLSLKSYYMGFYIHSCPKMRYKGRYNPSFLLCPETYDWIPIESAVSKLDVAKYSRLNDDTSAIDENGQLDINEIQVLYEQEPMRYGRYRILNADGADDDEVREYGTLVGAKCANSIYLYRS